MTLLSQKSLPLTAVARPLLMLSVPFALKFPSPRPLLCLANPRSYCRYFLLCEVLPKTLGQSPTSFLSVPVAGRSGTCSAARPTQSGDLALVILAEATRANDGPSPEASPSYPGHEEAAHPNLSGLSGLLRLSAWHGPGTGEHVVHRTRGV